MDKDHHSLDERYVCLDVNRKTVHAMELAKRRPELTDLLAQHNKLFSDG